LFNHQTLNEPGERMAWLAPFSAKASGQWNYLALTAIQDASAVAAFLKEQGIAARAYNADLEGAKRIGAERLLLGNDVKGARGYRRAGDGLRTNLIWICHPFFTAPAHRCILSTSWAKLVVAVDSAFGVLLSGREEDDEISDYFIRNQQFPARESFGRCRARVGKEQRHDRRRVNGELNYSIRPGESAESC